MAHLHAICITFGGLQLLDGGVQAVHSCLQLIRPHLDLHNPLWLQHPPCTSQLLRKETSTHINEWISHGG